MPFVFELVPLHDLMWKQQGSALPPVGQQWLQLLCKEEWDKNNYRDWRRVECQSDDIYIFLEHLVYNKQVSQHSQY